MDKVESDRPGVYQLELQDESYGPQIFDQVTQGHYIKAFSQQPPTLEAIFKMKAGGSNE